jgi:hypothetical protein
MKYFLFALLPALVGCDSGTSGAATAVPPSARPDASLAISAQPVAADGKQSDWGTIKGQIVWGGEGIPEAKPVVVTRDQNVCLEKGPILNDELVVNAKNKGVRWGFVWLEPMPGSPPLPIHPDLKEIKKKQVVLDQPCCRFEPHAFGLREGQEIVAKNPASVLHNLNYTGVKNPGNNLAIAAGQEITIKDLKADKYPVKLQCNIHPWMTGYVRIFDHPYFAVTDENGKFEIKQAPAGSFRLRGWHEAVGYVPGRNGMDIQIKGGEVTDVGDIKMSK